MPDNTNLVSRRYSRLGRREYLAGAAAGFAGFAGCIGGDGDGTPTDEPGDSDMDSDSDSDSDSDTGEGELDPDAPLMSRVAGAKLPSDMNWNPYSPNSPGHQWHVCEDVFACRPHASVDGRVLRALDDWEWNPDENLLTLTLRDDLIFWNGDQFTAEDLYVYDEMSRLAAPGVDPWDEIEIVDDLRVSYHIPDPPSEQLIQNTMLPEAANPYCAEQWQPWLEQFQDASNDEEIAELNEDIQEYTVTTEEFVENGWGTGVYEPVEWTETEMIYETVSHGEHRFSDDIDVPRFRCFLTDYGTARADQLFIDGEVDVHTAPLEPEIQDSGPDWLEHVAQWGKKWTYQMLINQRNVEALQDYNVRRAMAAVINTENVVTNWGDHRAFPLEHQAAGDTATVENLWGDDIDDLIDYSPQTSDFEKADRFLEMSGYSREGDTIYNPDGNEMERLNYITIADHLFTVPSETIVNQMQEYGFPIDYNAVPASQWSDTVSNNMADWDLSMQSFIARDDHYSSFFGDVIWAYRLTPGDKTVDEWLEEGRERSPYTGRELTPEIPVEVGQEDLSGETEEINITEIYNETRRSDDEEWVKEQFRKLSWFYNFHMTSVQVLVPTVATVGNTKDFDWPDEQTLISYDPNSPYRAIHEGSATYSDEWRN